MIRSILTYFYPLGYVDWRFAQHLILVGGQAVQDTLPDSPYSIELSANDLFFMEGRGEPLDASDFDVSQRNDTPRNIEHKNTVELKIDQRLWDQVRHKPTAFAFAEAYNELVLQVQAAKEKLAK